MSAATSALSVGTNGHSLPLPWSLM